MIQGDLRQFPGRQAAETVGHHGDEALDDRRIGMAAEIVPAVRYIVEDPHPGHATVHQMGVVHRLFREGLLALLLGDVEQKFKAHLVVERFERLCIVLVDRQIHPSRPA